MYVLIQNIFAHT